MDDLSKDIDKHKENIVKALKKSGTVELRTSKDGIVVIGIKREVLNKKNK